MGRQKWNDDTARTEALNHPNKMSLWEHANGCYSYIRRNDAWEDLAPHILITGQSRRNLTYYENNPKEGAKQGWFYVLEFTHKEEDITFIKVGITARGIERRYNELIYKEYTYQIITEYETTNLISAQIEFNLLAVNQHNRFSLDNHINFKGFTETLNINVKNDMIMLENLHQETTRDDK